MQQMVVQGKDMLHRSSSEVFAVELKLHDKKEHLAPVATDQQYKLQWIMHLC